MSKWVQTTLGKVVSAGGGKIQTGPFGSQLHASDYVESGIPCIMPANMKNNRVNLSGIAFISEKDAQRLSQHLVQEGDIVYSRRGDVTLKALIGKAEAGYFCGTGCLLVRPGNAIDSEFLTYHLSTPTNQDWIVKQAVGATMPNLNTSILAGFPLNVPPRKETQHQIAAVLVALDSKIDCNNRINAELEVMAQTLYDYWFVQFDFPDANGNPYRSSGGKMTYNATLKREIPTGWQDSNVLAVADLLGGGTPTKKKPEFWGGKIPFFTPTDADGSIFKFSTADYITDAGLKGSSTKLFSKHTVFITARGSVGKLVLAGVDMAMNQSCYALRAKPEVSHVFLFFLAKELIHHLQVKSSGSVFDSIVSNDIELTKLAIPKGDVIQKFSAVVEPLFAKIANNTKENQQLAQLRDWLLPLLMNGQVTVAQGARETQILEPA